MAFDKPTRNRLASFVGKARDLIAGEFTQQFQSLYGISDKGTIAPLEQLGHLDDIGLSTAALLRERIDYLVKTHPDDREGIKAAVARLAREQAFTVLNRLAAIRMAEKRGIIVESVGKGYQSKGFKVFEQVAGSGLGDTYHRYRRYIFCLFDELAVDLGVLFDRRLPQGLLFPSETAMQVLFAALNASDLDPLWAEDETIGWIYQYYNDPAERKKMREESAAPRNSRELAVRNQFFTPRYVVEFLTDNTLGRIWYEMTQGKTRLTAQCRYLVRWPTEIFLKPNETAPETLPQEDLSQEELLKQPVHIPHRPLKDPREIGLLDPACGSMHFGLYAFDLFEAIYEEAWDFGLEVLRRDYPEKDAFLREVPRMIIEYNIHGIDIDSRAAQIAGLSLWLRAQKSWQAQRVPAAQRPHIRRSNIVCAEPMPGSPELLKEFTATLHPPLLGQLVEKVFVQMHLAGEAGSLLMIEEEIATLVKDAKKLWQTRPKIEQMELNLGLEVKQKQGELPLDVSGISDERFWETAEARIYTALRAYAEQTESGGYQRRLFAEDAARGFAFIDLCRKRYDVVVMNPPFGLGVKQNFSWLKAGYPDGYVDLLSAFLSRAGCFCRGLVGTITSRSILVTKKLERLRSTAILPHITTLLDLGWAVMDGATVQSCAYTLAVDACLPRRFVAFDRRSLECKSQPLKLSSRGVERIYLPDRKALALLPRVQLLYAMPSKITSLLQSESRLRTTVLVAKHGMNTFNNFRFLRLRWEVSPALIGADSEWEPISKGGPYAVFYADLPLLVRWNQNGDEVAEENRRANGQTAQARQASTYYRLAGATYSRRSSKDFGVRVLPAGCIIGEKGPAVLATGLYSKEFVIALLNSRLMNTLVHIQANAKQYDSGILERLPWVVPNPEVVTELEALSGNCIRAVRDSACLNDIDFGFCGWPFGSSLATSGELWKRRLENMKSTLDESMSRINYLVDTTYGIDSHELRQIVVEEPEDDAYESQTEEDGDAEEGVMPYAFSAIAVTQTLLSLCLCALDGRWDIRFATGERRPLELPDPFAPLPVCPPGMLQNTEGLPAEPKDMPADYPLRISWPGILVDDENHPEDIVARIREVLEVIWKDRAETIEHEACELLSVKTLRDYFRRPAGFFADHLKRYSKSRRQAPIYWPLSTAKGSYTLWIYYHRLTDQTLHTALADFVDPKLKAVRAEIGALRESGNHRNRLEELLDLERELADFHTEIERIIKLPWKPNLNDGVLITASPLWKLFRLPKWQKDLKACWEILEKGDYDWAHLAYSIWPKRVEEVCKNDRSIAIAHGLEAICKTENPKPKKTRNRRQSNGGA